MAIKTLYKDGKPLTLDGKTLLVNVIEAEGAKINIPDGCILTTGTFTPVESGKDVINQIRIAQSLGDYPYVPVHLFCIARSDGFDATGSTDTGINYLVAYCGFRASAVTELYKRNGGGTAIYRKGGTFTTSGGTETTTTASYGIPGTGEGRRTNCYIRYISADGKLEFSSYGLVCLEAAKEYRWLAIIGEGATT